MKLLRFSSRFLEMSLNDSLLKGFAGGGKQSRAGAKPDCCPGCRNWSARPRSTRRSGGSRCRSRRSSCGWSGRRCSRRSRSSKFEGFGCCVLRSRVLFSRFSFSGSFDPPCTCSFQALGFNVCSGPTLQTHLPSLSASLFEHILCNGERAVCATC